MNTQYKPYLIRNTCTCTEKMCSTKRAQYTRSEQCKLSILVSPCPRGALSLLYITVLSQPPFPRSIHTVNIVISLQNQYKTFHFKLSVCLSVCLSLHVCVVMCLSLFLCVCMCGYPLPIHIEWFGMGDEIEDSADTHRGRSNSTTCLLMAQHHL